MNTPKWPQEFIVKTVKETCLKQTNPCAAVGKARPERDESLNCPRCNSLNTKFCYYNNYSLTQPRYFCKDCKRYWTQGGSLRNIPIGGAVRKNKRSSSSSPSLSSKKTHIVTNKTPPPLEQLNFIKTGESAHEAKDLFGTGLPEFLQVVPSSMKRNNSFVTTSSALELLGISNASTASPAFVTYPNVHDGGFGMGYPQFQEFMRPPALGFSINGGVPLHQEEGSSGTNNGRPLLAFESLKLHVSSSSTISGGGNGNHDHEKEEGEADNAVGFWNGMLSAGASAGGSWQ